jgi:hypothetical protein
MQDSNPLGFRSIRPDGKIAEAPTWQGPVLPGEPQPPSAAPKRRTVLPGEPQPIRYRQTVRGHRVAWDEPSENF